MTFHKFRISLSLLLAGLFVSLFPGPLKANAEDIDLALVLAVDVSSSVNWNEFGLQMRGLSSAFRDDNVWQAVRSGAHQKISIALLQWAGDQDQRLSIGWTLIVSRQDLFDIADQVDNLARAFPFGGTGLAAALQASAALFDLLPFVPARKVIDLSGDGRATVGNRPEAVRDWILANDITINGLPILNEEKNLEDYYRASVIGGLGAFTEIAADYDDFATALSRKLAREIAGPWMGASLRLTSAIHVS